MNSQELANYFNTTITTIATKFPTFCEKQLKNGYYIEKTGYGKKANYTVEKITEDNKEKIKNKIEEQKNSKVNIYKHLTLEEIQTEQWIDCYALPDTYLISNLGRIKNKINGKILRGNINPQGYVQIGLKNYKTYKLHRLVLQSWVPQPNFEDLTVDHINGIKLDNRLTNLRWGTNEENIMWMISHRVELAKETTRLIDKYGYDKTLEILRQIKQKFWPKTNAFGQNFYYTIPQQFCQQANCTKILLSHFPKIFLCKMTKSPHDRPPPLLPRSQVKISPNFTPAFCAIFQLVIYKNLWYNTGVPNEGATPKSHLKKT